ncbi:FISUMP domain-containing protein [Bacteroidota bacterium]
MKAVKLLFTQILFFGIIIICSCESEPEPVLKYDPVCNITNPGVVKSFKKGTTVAISADASDENGQIIEVEFIIDNINVETFTESPYNYNWNTNDVSLGDHLLKVLAKDNEYNVAVDSIIIKIIEKDPVADFIYDKTNIEPWGRIKFNDMSLNNPTEWKWNFGDGKSSIEQNPVHIYGRPGTYSVALKVTNGTGSHSVCKENIITVDQPQTGTLTDIEGNVYNTIKISEQWWMAENITVTKYNDGNEIPLIDNNVDWSNLPTPGYCYYDDDISYKELYGVLYNWYVVETNKLCPEGWHVPSNEEWVTLELTLGMDTSVVNDIGYRGTDEGDKLKSSSGWFNNGNGTNESGFKALPGGYRNSATGSFDISGRLYGSFWTSSTAARVVTYNNSLISKTYLYKSVGVSVRCLEDQK